MSAAKISYQPSENGFCTLPGSFDPGEISFGPRVLEVSGVIKDFWSGDGAFLLLPWCCWFHEPKQTNGQPRGVPRGLVLTLGIAVLAPHWSEL